MFKVYKCMSWNKKKSLLSLCCDRDDLILLRNSNFI